MLSSSARPRVDPAKPQLEPRLAPSGPVRPRQAPSGPVRPRVDPGRHRQVPGCNDRPPGRPRQASLGPGRPPVDPGRYRRAPGWTPPGLGGPSARPACRVPDQDSPRRFWKGPVRASVRRTSNMKENIRDAGRMPVIFPFSFLLSDSYFRFVILESGRHTFPIGFVWGVEKFVLFDCLPENDLCAILVLFFEKKKLC